MRVIGVLKWSYQLGCTEDLATFCHCASLDEDIERRSPLSLVVRKNPCGLQSQLAKFPEPWTERPNQLVAATRNKYLRFEGYGKKIHEPWISKRVRRDFLLLPFAVVCFST